MRMSMKLGNLSTAIALIAYFGASSAAHAANGVPKPAHIVVVMEENHAYDEIIGSSSAPYLNSLASQGALFTQSFAIEHPSQPNYLDIFSGTDQGVTSDNCPQSFSTANLGGELLKAGYTFKGYSEELPSTGSTTCSVNNYVRRHCPWTDFVSGTYAVPASDSLPFQNYYPGTISPVNYNNLPTVSFVIPDLMDDMHNGTIAQADSWAQEYIDGYAQWAKKNNSLLIITWDEDDYTESNRICTIIVGQSVIPGQYSNTINHYSILRTIEDAYGLPYAGQSGSVSPINYIWN
jgi:acid phosphatase